MDRARDAPPQITLKQNRGGMDNKEFLANAIMEGHVAQYRAARSEPHYRFAQTALIRACIVVEGIDVECEEVQRQQASATSQDRHDIQIQHFQWERDCLYVYCNAIGGDEVTRTGNPRVSFLGIYVIGVVRLDAPAPYHSLTPHRRYRAFMGAARLSSGSGSGKKTAAALAPHYATVLLRLPNYPSYMLGDDASANPKAVKEHLRAIAPLLVRLPCQGHRPANGLKHAMDNMSGKLNRPSLAHSRDRYIPRAWR